MTRTIPQAPCRKRPLAIPTWAIMFLRTGQVLRCPEPHGVARPETIRLFLRYLRYHPSLLPPLPTAAPLPMLQSSTYACRTARQNICPCLVLHCLALTPPHPIGPPKQHQGPSSTAGVVTLLARFGYYHPHLIRPEWRPKRVEKGRDLAARSAQLHGLSKPKVLLAAGRPGMALLGNLVAASSVGKLTQPN